MRISFLVRRVGPYHHSRFEAAGRLAELTVVETRPSSIEYPWTTAAAARNYQLVTLGIPEAATGRLRSAALRRTVAECMSDTRLDVVVCTGWADPEYHNAVRYCGARNIPTVAMCDSTRDDEPRSGWKETIKSHLVKGYSAMVVAGTRSRAYVHSLGFPVEAIFEPWDVVDNAYFERAATAARADLVTLRTRLRLPRPYFLCISRYIPEKNLLGLLDGFAQYRLQHGVDAWDLVILGSGELEDALRARISALALGGHVHLPGFVQYHELPQYYAGAGVCVLASLRDTWGLVVNEAMAAGLPVLVSRACGCAPDLVADGENGFSFDPLNIPELAALMHKVALMPGEERKRLGANGRSMIQGYSVDAFASALKSAAEYAIANRRRLSLRTRLLLAVLCRRRA